MRIWSLHPRHLDRAGLLACWREALLAQAVLAGRTRGYQHHPQLERFRATPDPLAAIATYLAAVADEADQRGYRFDRTRVLGPADATLRLPVTTGQLTLEWHHLGAKLLVRSPEQWQSWQADRPSPHPLFDLVDGPVADWERAVAPH